MEAFLEQLRVLQTQFDALSSEDHEEALAAVAEAVSSMRDASVRRRFEKEVELTLAWEAEKMIVERFAGDCSMIGVYSGPSTSAFDLEANFPFYDNIDSNESGFIWSQPGVRDQSAGKHLQSELEAHILNSSDLELSKGNYLDQDHRPKMAEAAAIEEECGVSRQSSTPNELSGSSANSGEALPSVGAETGKENRFICATCGYLANNRKALYRHGLKTQHLLRSSNTAGSLACEICSFRTNKTFNFNRHMKRFHTKK